MKFYRAVYYAGIGLLCIIMVVFLVAVAQGQVRPQNTGIVYARDYGVANGITLTNLISRLGTREVTVVLDGGRWGITNNVTIPTNVGVQVEAGTYFAIASGYTITFQTNSLYAGPYPIFTGAGFAAGTGLFTYRYPEWGSTTQYNIGLGKIGYTNLNDFLAVDRSFTMNAGTTGALKTASAVDMTIGTATIGTSTVIQSTITTGDFATVDIDTIYSTGWRVDPASTTLTFSDTNESSTSAQAKIDALPHWIPPDETLLINWSAGRYTNYTSALDINGFFGGGTLSIWGISGGGALSTSQTAWLDFAAASNTSHALIVNRNSVYVDIQNLRLRGDPSSLSYGTLNLGENLHVGMQGCFIENVDTNQGNCLYVQNCPSIQMARNYFNRGAQAMFVSGSQFYSESNITEAANSDVGAWVRYGTFATGFNASQPYGKSGAPLVTTNDKSVFSF